MLYMQQQAWIASKPERAKIPDILPPIPKRFEFIVQIVFDIGFSKSGGGVNACTESELHYWQLNQGLKLKPTVAKLVRRASQEFVGALGKYLADQKASAPYQPKTPRAIKQRAKNKVSVWDAFERQHNRAVEAKRAKIKRKGD